MVAAARPGSDCELAGDGLLGQPVNTVTSLAFVVAAAAILAGPDTDPRTRRLLTGLVAGVGVGSVVQHGPDPAWADLAHDLPLVALLAFVAADSVADLTGRPRRAGWWLPPAIAVTAVGLALPRTADALQAAVAVVAIAATLQRARRRPALGRRIVVAAGLLGAGALLGTLTRTGSPWCRPTSLLQGHGAWHVLAAAALWRLAPALGPARAGAAQTPDHPASVGARGGDP